MTGPPHEDGRPRALETILPGGVAVALLDIANAMAFWALYRGIRPVVVLQSVSAGLLGKEAFLGGASTAWLGAFLHLFIAYGVGAGFHAACTLLPALGSGPFGDGAIQGAAVYLVMNYLVIPLSRASAAPFRAAWFPDDFIGHLLLVGPPVAFIARWSASRSSGDLTSMA